MRARRETVSPSGPLLPPEGLPDLPERYVLLQLLGQGGMGRVYLCRDTVLEVDVAIKVLPPKVAEDGRALRRISEEAKVAARLRGGPGILALYGFEHHGDAWFLVTEYAAGGTLHDRIRDQGRLPEAGCRRVGAEVAEALAFAHGRGVLHRDIKPGNILLDIHGRALVADFGLARVVAGAYGEARAAPVEGTPEYMAPEVIRGRAVDGRSDLYSLGATLYEVAVGAPPFHGPFAEVAAAKLRAGAVAPDPREVRPDLSEAFASVVRRLMDPDPAKRPAGAAAVAGELRGPRPTSEDPAPAPVPGGAPTRDDTVGTRTGRGRTPLLAGAALAAAAALGGWWAFLRPGETAATPSLPASPAPSPPPAPAVAEVFDALVVRTRPPGATVLVDGEARGTAGEEGLRIADLEPGVPHTVRAEMEDHEPDEESGVVWEEGVLRPPVILKLRRKSGVLQLVGGRPGAAVTLAREGEAVRTLALDGEGNLPPLPLAVGTWTVEASLPGFETWRREVRVRSAATEPLAVSMPERDGTLSVDTAPPGAEVFAGERSLGRTPIRRKDLPAGTHSLRLVHPEATTVVREAEVRGERETDLGTVTLPPLAALDLSALPEGVTATVEGAPVEGALRRQPGTLSLVLHRAGHRDQILELSLGPGPNPLPAPGPWVPLPGYLSLAGLPSGTRAFLGGSEIVAGPVPVPPGSRRVLLVRAGFPLQEVAVEVPSEATVALEAPPWTRHLVPYPEAHEFTSSSPSRRRRALAQAGESVVAAGLDWLARHQSADGSFSSAGFADRCAGDPRCAGPGSPLYTTGLTALSLLAFQRAGETADGARYGATVRAAREFLIRAQGPDGTYGPRIGTHWVYNHAAATLAMAEALVGDGEPRLRESVERAVAVVLERQNAYLGWRYGGEKGENDTSVTAWMAKALAAARDAGVAVPPERFRWALNWVERVTEPEWGRVGYGSRDGGSARLGEMRDRFPREQVESTTALGLQVHLAAGRDASSDLVAKGLDLLGKRLPLWDEAAGSIDFYYWFFGTEVLASVGADRWERWRTALVAAVPPHQHRAEGADTYGSWDPVDPWQSPGGRVYTTALGTLMAQRLREPVENRK